MSSIPERVATITDPLVVGHAHRLRRLSIASEVAIWGAFGVALAVPGEAIPSSVLTVGLVGLGLHELRRGVLKELRRIVGRQRFVVDPHGPWIRLTRTRKLPPGAWAYDLSRADPSAPLLVPSLLACVVVALLAPRWLPLAAGVGLVHLTAGGVLKSSAARGRVLAGLAVLGCLAAGRQFLRFSTEDQTRAAAAVLLLLAPIGAGWALRRPVWNTVVRAPNVRRAVVTLARDGRAAVIAALALALTVGSLVFAYSRGLLLAVVTSGIVGISAEAGRVPPALVAAATALAVVGWLHPPPNAESLALMAVAAVAWAVSVRYAWPDPFIVASLTAGALHVIAVRPFVTAVFALTFAVVAALPRQDLTAETKG